MATSLLLALLFPASLPASDPPRSKYEAVAFQSGKLALQGLLYKPEGKGLFPAVLYNHGSAPGMLNQQAAERLGPLFAGRGWVFFMPYRRGQGLSESAGPYIMDEVRAAERRGGTKAGAETLLRLMTTDHLDDQLAALEWLRKAGFVKPGQIAVAGNSFGGIQAVLGAEKGSYCAGVDAAGAAQSWADAPGIQKAMLEAVRRSRAPIFFFQAENDYDLTPSKALSSAMKEAGKTAEMKIYPAFGSGRKDGHSFPYMGESVWADDVFGFLARHCQKQP